MSCSPQELGGRFTAEEFNQLHALHAAGELQGT
jgi:hypothetical protein